jgi:hypothetical protein
LAPVQFGDPEIVTTALVPRSALVFPPPAMRVYPPPPPELTTRV